MKEKDVKEIAVFLFHGIVGTMLLGLIPIFLYWISH